MAAYNNVIFRTLAEPSKKHSTPICHFVNFGGFAMVWVGLGTTESLEVLLPQCIVLRLDLRKIDTRKVPDDFINVSSPITIVIDCFPNRLMRYNRDLHFWIGGTLFAVEQQWLQTAQRSLNAPRQR